MGEIKSKTSSWKLGKQAARSCNKNFAAEFAKSKKETKGITLEYINTALKCSPNFIGCFTQDQLTNVFINDFPCFAAIHISDDHWIALGLYASKIEVFDPLGFDILNWKKPPHELLSFLHRMSVTRRVSIIPRLQPDNSVTCGYYAIYYIIQRQFSSLKKTLSCFSSVEHNDDVLYTYFK